MDNILKLLKNNKRNILLIIVIIVSIFGNFLIYSLFYHKKVVNIEVTAHRGYSSKYPENTLLSFSKAIEVNSNEIELDVRLTKDNKVVVLHDSNLNRVGNVNKYVSNIKYEDLKKIKVGDNETVPLFEDVLKLIQDKDIKVNIELKSIEKNEQLVQSTIDLINKYNLKDKCYFSSFEYSMLLKVKEIDSSFKTLFISNSSDNLFNYEVDGYSLNHKCVDINLVKEIHKNNKEIHVWTVNSEDDIYSMIKMNVDNIITNNVELVQNMIDKFKKG